MKIEKDDKWLVFNMKFINELSPEGEKRLAAVCEELSEKFPRIKDNKYVCCNQDEPYAEEVWEIILRGEREKQELHKRAVKNLQAMGEPGPGRGRIVKEEAEMPGDK